MEDRIQAGLYFQTSLADERIAGLHHPRESIDSDRAVQAKVIVLYAEKARLHAMRMID